MRKQVKFKTNNIEFEVSKYSIGFDGEVSFKISDDFDVVYNFLNINQWILNGRANNTLAAYYCLHGWMEDETDFKLISIIEQTNNVYPHILVNVDHDFNKSWFNINRLPYRYQKLRAGSEFIVSLSANELQSFADQEWYWNSHSNLFTNVTYDINCRIDLNHDNIFWVDSVTTGQKENNDFKVIFEKWFIHGRKIYDGIGDVISNPKGLIGTIEIKDF